MGRRVVVRSRAQKDLNDLYDHICQSNAGSMTAIRFVRRIRSVIESLADSPERGRPRDDIQPGLRVLALEKRVVIAYRVERDEVVIGRVFYRGRDFLKILGASWLERFSI